MKSYLMYSKTSKRACAKDDYTLNLSGSVPPAVQRWPATERWWGSSWGLRTDCPPRSCQASVPPAVCCGLTKGWSVARQKWKCRSSFISAHAKGLVVSIATRLFSSPSLSFCRFTFHITLQSYVTDPNTNKEVKITISMVTLENYPITMRDNIWRCPQHNNMTAHDSTWKKSVEWHFFQSKYVILVGQSRQKWAFNNKWRVWYEKLFYNV